MAEHLFQKKEAIMTTFFSAPSICEKYRSDILHFFSGKGVLRTYAKKSVIKYDGNTLDHIYLIREGCIQQYFLDDCGNKKILLLLIAGDIFGEISLLQQDEDKVITAAITPAVIEKIKAPAFFSQIDENPELSLAIMRMHSNKIRILMAQIQDSSFCTTTLKLRNLLIRLAHQHGKPTSKGIQIGYSFTQNELADMLSSTRSTITKCLTQLKKENVIEMENHHIIIKEHDNETRHP